MSAPEEQKPDAVPENPEQPTSELEYAEALERLKGFRVESTLPGVLLNTIGEKVLKSSTAMRGSWLAEAIETPGVIYILHAICWSFFVTLNEGLEARSTDTGEQKRLALAQAGALRALLSDFSLCLRGGSEELLARVAAGVAKME